MRLRSILPEDKKDTFSNDLLYMEVVSDFLVELMVQQSSTAEFNF